MHRNRVLAIVLGGAAAVVMLAAPAGAQFSGSRSAFDDRPGAELIQFRDFFQFPFGGGGGRGQGNFFNPGPANPQRVPQAYEATKPPPPRKVETPPTSTVVVVGDGLADWLSYGLEEAFTDTPEVGIVRKIKPYSGLIRYEAARGEVQEWVAGRQGSDRAGKARCHCCHAWPERPPSVARSPAAGKSRNNIASRSGRKSFCSIAGGCRPS